MFPPSMQQLPVSGNELCLEIKTERSIDKHLKSTSKMYRGPNPPPDPLGQSFNDFYKPDITGLHRNRQPTAELDTEVMAAAIRWIEDHLGHGSFNVADGEDCKTAVIRHLDSMRV